MLYDAFISHASEDKLLFVRPLAEALNENNIAVWYDEFSLKPGDSLRRSIDLGLSKSRFGIVVLSRAFMGKQWPEWELDGLIQRQNSGNESIIIPMGLTSRTKKSSPFRRLLQTSLLSRPTWDFLALSRSYSESSSHRARL